jgi:hypothetical protein
MPFSQFSHRTISQAWQLARGRCECQRENHSHDHRCASRVALHAHGSLSGGGWFAMPWTPLGDGGMDATENVEVLCVPCYHRVTQEGPPV